MLVLWVLNGLLSYKVEHRPAMCTRYCSAAADRQHIDDVPALASRTLAEDFHSGHSPKDCDPGRSRVSLIRRPKADVPQCRKS